MESNYNRRNFIKQSLLYGGALCLPSLDPLSVTGKTGSPKALGRVVISRSDLVRHSKNSLQSGVVNNLLNKALEALFEVNSAKTAWSSLFSKADVVGIKINCLAGRGISTSVELVEAIVENLLAAGISKERIIIWDRANDDLERGGYRIQTSSRAVKCYGNDYAGYTDDIYEAGAIGSLLSKILVQQCTAIINVPILKDHGIVGLTNALKNFFGAIHNPNKYHSHIGDPYVADVNLLPPIRNKLRLTICDALTAQYEGGPPFMPQWSWNYNGLLVGTDMVALDTVGWKIIEDKRKEKGLPSLKQAGREPTYIATAADARHRLGTNDWNSIKLIEI